MHLKTGTEKIILTISLVSFGMFLGAMVWFLYQNVNETGGQLSVSTSAQSAAARVYSNKNYDKFETVSIPLKNIVLDEGDLYVSSKYYKIIAESKISLSVNEAKFDFKQGLAYISTTVDLLFKFDDTNFYTTIPKDSKVFVDGFSRRIIYIEKSAEQRWLVDTWGTLTFNMNELKTTPAYKNLMLLLDNLEQLPVDLRGYLD